MNRPTPGPHIIVPQPKVRSPLRRRVGQEYFIIKRYLRWIRRHREYARERSSEALTHRSIVHRSMLLRPLQGVDMQLQHNKVTNLRLAIDRVDGLLIRPGETFSLWQRVGRPTVRRGFLEGLVLDSGKITSGVGGGVCQLGNLLYWMALHTPLEVRERWRHSYDVFPDVNRTLPFGSGATLSYNYIDLAIANPTDRIWQINLDLDDSHMIGSICTDREHPFDYHVFETDHAFRVEWWGGYTRHNRIWREITNRSTGERQIAFVTENHAIMMYEPMLEGDAAPRYGNRQAPEDILS